MVAKRERYYVTRRNSKERDATVSILRLSRDVINTSNRDELFLNRFVEYALRTLQGDGAAVLTCDDEGTFHGCAVSGIFPLLKEVPTQVEQQLIAHAKKHTEFIKDIRIPFNAAEIDAICEEKGYAFYKNEIPKGFPPNFSKEAPRILIAPIKRGGNTLGCVIVTSKDDFDSRNLRASDGEYMARLAEIAALSLEVLRVFRERREYEERLQNAREEGMLQVSTGIIHNIGNAITVAKLTIAELQEKIANREENPESFILDEIIPKLKSEIQAGSIGTFLAEDEIGKQYLDIVAELMRHNIDKESGSVSLLNSLSEKLYHISEIIELQQRFVGELGTENMVQVSNVLRSSIKIYEETCNKRGYQIITELEDGLPEVLVDSSMMTQVFMNLIKNAVEAMDSDDNSKEHRILIKTTLEANDGGDGSLVRVETSDNGPGIPKEAIDKIFDFGFSTKGNESGRGFGLHSCRETVKKYGGNISVESKIGEGATFCVEIPVRQEKASSPEKAETVQS